MSGVAGHREAPKTVRVIIYTRMGRADDLESLRLQEEAIAHYLASGKINRWVSIGETYQDIGYPAKD